MKQRPTLSLIKPTAQQIERLFTVLTGRAPTASEMANVRFILEEAERFPKLGSQYDEDGGEEDEQ